VTCHSIVSHIDLRKGTVTLFTSILAALIPHVIVYHVLSAGYFRFSLLLWVGEGWLEYEAAFSFCDLFYFRDVLQACQGYSELCVPPGCRLVEFLGGIRAVYVFLPVFAFSRFHGASHPFPALFSSPFMAELSFVFHVSNMCLFTLRDRRTNDGLWTGI
jgi:hypothetical protein